MKNPEFIIHRFIVKYNPLEPHIMYAELLNDRYAKIYFSYIQNKTISEYISKEEYIAALAHIMLKQN